MSELETASERQNAIVMVLYSFLAEGRDEVSLPEFLECIESIQKEIPLKYKFLDQFLYSPDLLEDLRDLEYRGLARRFTYRHDSFIPKSFITLTGMGKASAERIAQKFPCKYIPILENSVKAAIQNSKEMWKIYGRSESQSYEMKNC
ncbi:MAG: hypothetical protein ABSB71_01095 [Candidatus Bathyarchaeia archaeon]|jgi:hypothetical protein